MRSHYIETTIYRMGRDKRGASGQAGKKYKHNCDIYTHTHIRNTLYLCNLEWTHDEFIRVNILERFEFYHIFDGLKTGRWSNMRDRLETAKVSVSDFKIFNDCLNQIKNDQF